MSADKHPAEVLADRVSFGYTKWDNPQPVVEMLRRIPALEAERDQWITRANDLDAQLFDQWITRATDLDAQLFDVTAERDQLRAEVEALRALALEHVAHVYQGDCPDELDRTRRDPNCPACALLCARKDTHD